MGADNRGVRIALQRRSRLRAIVCLGVVLIVALTLAGTHLHFLVLPAVLFFLTAVTRVLLFPSPERDYHYGVRVLPAFSPRPPPVQ